VVRYADELQRNRELQPILIYKSTSTLCRSRPRPKSAKPSRIGDCIRPAYSPTVESQSRRANAFQPRDLMAALVLLLAVLRVVALFGTGNNSGESPTFFEAARLQRLVDINDTKNWCIAIGHFTL
jgi:hypothetical protein